jgi:glycosyltransferase involved in cell wall biosynthesis
VFLFLSLYEGFGLTPLEALATGAAVVSSSRSALPEVLNGVALLVNPEDYRETAAAVLSLLRDDNHRRELGSRGPARAARFTWQMTGQATLRAYESLLPGT